MGALVATQTWTELPDECYRWRGRYKALRLSVDVLDGMVRDSPHRADTHTRLLKDGVPADATLVGSFLWGGDLFLVYTRADWPDVTLKVEISQPETILPSPTFASIECDVIKEQRFQNHGGVIDAEG